MKRLTNAERLKALYAIGKLTLDEFMERVDAELAAGTLDYRPPEPKRGSPQAAAEKWSASASASSAKWAENVEREAARIRTEQALRTNGSMVREVA